jgi:O-acetyl-ADP-ribose deacetylase (regulator of RNase III)
MFNLEFKDATTSLLVIVAAVTIIAIIGTNPLAPSTILSGWSRIGLGASAIGFLILILILPRFLPKSQSDARPDPEYLKRFQAAQSSIADITPEDRIIAEATIKGIKVDVINGNILDARTDVIVSSDDNHFTAKGGVARAILGKAGPEVQSQLARYRKRRFRQGQVAITTGGQWTGLAIIHPAVIDLDENRYPDKAVVSLIVRRCLSCATALGAESIAFPVLGGGTASKTLKSSDSVRAIVETISSYLRETLETEAALNYVALYVYDKNDAVGLPPNLQDLAKA